MSFALILFLLQQNDVCKMCLYRRETQEYSTKYFKKIHSAIKLIKSTKSAIMLSIRNWSRI